MYLFHGQLQFSIEGLGLLQVLAEIRQLTKDGKLLHLYTVALQFFHKAITAQLEHKYRNALNIVCFLAIKVVFFHFISTRTV